MIPLDKIKWGQYEIILLDPPWKYPHRNEHTIFGSGMSKYPGMTIKQLMELDIQKLCAPNCAIFTWTVSPFLDEYFVKVLPGWGLTHVNKAFCWEKESKDGVPRHLTGHYTGSNTEDCYLARHGQILPMVQDNSVRQVLRTTLAKDGPTQGIHSRKPDEFRQRMVQLFGDRPRIELFATEIVDGWDHMGYAVDGRDIREVLKHGN